MLIGYVRVSTDEHDTAAQVATLHAAAGEPRDVINGRPLVPVLKFATIPFERWSKPASPQLVEKNVPICSDCCEIGSGIREVRRSVQQRPPFQGFQHPEIAQEA